MWPSASLSLRDDFFVSWSARLKEVRINNGELCEPKAPRSDGRNTGVEKGDGVHGLFLFPRTQESGLSTSNNPA